MSGFTDPRLLRPPAAVTDPRTRDLMKDLQAARRTIGVAAKGVRTDFQAADAALSAQVAAKAAQTSLDALAARVSALEALAQGGPLLRGAHGSTSFNFSAQSSKSLTISHGLGVTPRSFATVTWNIFSVETHGETSTSFTAIVSHIDGTNITGLVDIHWICALF